MRTNRRVNRWLLGNLATGKPHPHIGFIDVATLHIGGEQVILDLSRKDQRLLLENLILQQEPYEGLGLQNP
jgi:hypothetical protein